MMETFVSFKIKKFENGPILAESLAEEILSVSLKADADGQDFHISLSGGSTPKILFKTLVREEYAEAVKWNRLHFWWGDDRMVPESSDESNFGEAKRMLFDHVNIPIDHLHPVLGEHDLYEEVKRYADEMNSIMVIKEGMPIYDWIILGMGDDGHTASLFPDVAPLDSRKITLAAAHPISGQKRVSLSLKAINSAKRISFLVTGANKKKRIHEIFTDRSNHLHFPAACVEGDRVEWWMDYPAMELVGTDYSA